jgi:predicted AAA+ superfamily ATPase
MISRRHSLEQVLDALHRVPIAGLLGPRQIGKTTLAKEAAARFATKGQKIHWFDLENPVDFETLKQPNLALAPLKGLVVLDEIQRNPGLFPYLRVLADRPEEPAKFLILGSASPSMRRQSNESLAGRISYHELGGINLDEAGAEFKDRLWLRGGFPLSYLAASDQNSLLWRQEFMAQFIDRDIPALGSKVPGEALHRFWSMLAHLHGQLFNAAALAHAMDITRQPVRNYLDLLTDTYMVRQLKPWHENISKRQVKAPKIYIRDSGLLHALLGIETSEVLARHPKVGLSWESFAMEYCLRFTRTRHLDAYVWATHQGAELDLLVVRGMEKFGFEFKRTAVPALTRSMRQAMEDLKLNYLTVVHAGEREHSLAENVRAVPLAGFAAHWEKIRKI